MRGSDENDLYKEGQNLALDKRYSVYKKMRVFAGDGVDEALSDEEGSLLVKLWIKEVKTPWKMLTKDVLTLVDLTERVKVWRQNERREKGRIRNERRRKKLRDAARNHDAGAVEKLGKIKKADAIYSANYRKKKRVKISSSKEI